jgi:hypothetical protein
MDKISDRRTLLSLVQVHKERLIFLLELYNLDSTGIPSLPREALSNGLDLSVEKEQLALAEALARLREDGEAELKEFPNPLGCQKEVSL